jgi:hypothetical protein
MQVTVFRLNYKPEQEMKRIITIILVSLSFAAFSQEILLEQNVKADSVRPTWGPNLKNYIHGYFGLGFPIHTNGQVAYTAPGASYSFDVGMRYKRRFTNYFAMGIDLGLTLASYKIKQNQGKYVPDTVINDKEKFQISSAVSSAYIRINMGRRGNYIGNYIDLGAYGGWNMVKKHRTTNENADGEKVKIVTSRLKYVENFSYGLLARMGTGRWVLKGTYRLSDIFEPSYQIPELPRLIVGVEIGLFK